MRTKKQISGFTLIEIMVGMVISILVILAATAAYKSYGKIAYRKGGLKPTSEQLTQLSNAVITVSLKVQNAGFGLTPAINTHIQIFKDAHFLNGTLTGDIQSISGTAATGNAVVWVENNKTSSGDSFQCKGFVSDLVTTQLIFISKSDCSSISNSDWSAVAITKEAAFPAPITFSAQLMGGCSPFGSINSDGVSNAGLVLTTTNQSSFKINKHKSCLLNF